MWKGLIVLIIGLCLAGCATTGGGGERVDEVHLFGLPVTLNLDGKPGADGFAARVFVTKNGRGKGAAITSGALEMLMFDGVVGSDEIAAKEPVQTWKFTPQDLAKLREETSLGAGYRFALRWNKPPTRNHITVAARYVPTRGEPVYSSPSALTSPVK